MPMFVASLKMMLITTDVSAFGNDVVICWSFQSSNTSLIHHFIHSNTQSKCNQTEITYNSFAFYLSRANTAVYLTFYTFCILIKTYLYNCYKNLKIMITFNLTKHWYTFISKFCLKGFLFAKLFSSISLFIFRLIRQ